MRCFICAVVLMALAVAGCGGGDSVESAGTNPDEANTPEAAPTQTVEAPSMPAIIPTLPAVDPNAVTDPTTDPIAETEPAAPAEVEQIKAEAGVGKKGRSLDEYEGVVVTPAKTLFTVRERVVFEVQIPQALQLYKASNGSGPKSHEEFMTQIVSANRINLPELQEGSRYLYDPETEQLMVERKR